MEHNQVPAKQAKAEPAVAHARVTRRKHKQTNREIAGTPLPLSIERKGKTTILTKQGAILSRHWFVCDATGLTLGRLSSEVAKVLRGKHRPDYTPNVDCGDGVIIVNAEKIQVTGMKRARKIYRKYTGFIGGLRETPYSTMMDRNPEYILERAIKGMMPKTRLGDQQLKKLRVVKGPNQPLIAQKPTPLVINAKG